jgi:replicative DNA helicase
MSASLEVERAAAGSVLADPTLFGSVAAIAPCEFFEDAQLRRIMEAAAKLASAGREHDLVAVCDELPETLRVVAVDAYRVGEVSGVNAEAYAERVALHHQRRQVRRIGAELAKMPDNAEPGEFTERARKSLEKLESPVSTEWETTLADALLHYVEQLDARTDGQQGHTTGFLKLDRMLGRLRDGELTVVGSRPGMGKTSFGTSLAIHVALGLGVPVAFASLEQPADQLTERMIAHVARIPLLRLREGALQDDDYPRLVDAQARLSLARIAILDRPAAPLSEIAAFCRRCKGSQGLGLIIVDYLQKVRPQDLAAPGHEQVAAIAMGAKALARTLRVPVVALAQLNRELEQRQNKFPQLADLRGSGVIEQEADQVVLLYREGYYKEGHHDPADADLFVAKNRHGPSDRTVKVRFDAEHCRFHDDDKT